MLPLWINHCIVLCYFQLLGRIYGGVRELFTKVKNISRKSSIQVEMRKVVLLHLFVTRFLLSSCQSENDVAVRSLSLQIDLTLWVLSLCQRSVCCAVSTEAMNTEKCGFQR